MSWIKREIHLENGNIAKAQSPYIISASRSTDIPAFYSDWFFHRLEKGYSAWINPFNGEKSYVSYQDVRFIVFWSKNPKPLLEHIHKLNMYKPHINCYIQYTLNDYEAEGLEKGVPSLNERIETFKVLTDKLGKGHVIWRFDPLILTDSISINTLLKTIEKIGDNLVGYTEKLVFSFADIESYRKVKTNLIHNNIYYNEWSEESMIEFAQRLSLLNKSKGWNYILSTCGEKSIFKEFDIDANRCIDDNLMIRFAWKDDILMNFLGVKIYSKDSTMNLFDQTEKIPEKAILLDDKKHYAVKSKNNTDKGQRILCGCVVSKDIGEYNTCPHQCEYCYANTSKETAITNYNRHKLNPYSETITGK